MYVLNGKRVSDGIAIGRIAFYKRKQWTIQKREIEDISAEVKRFEEAKEVAVGEIQVLYEQSVNRVGQKNALIFGIHQMMLEDSEFLDAVVHMITNDRVNAEYAVYVTSQQFEGKLRGQGRAEDMQDVSERLIHILLGKEKITLCTNGPVIVVADDLLPSETVQLDSKKVSGLVMLKGAQNSHTSIFARTMGIPAMIGTGEALPNDCDGAFAIMDGEEGTFYVHPNQETIEKMRKKQGAEETKRLQMEQFKGKRTKMHLCANIGSVEDIESALQNDADGIGLVRSEVLCLRQGIIPAEEQQFQIYRGLAEKMGSKRVVVRTWDMGADKQVNGLAFGKEENPALGCRGIRFCLAHPALFKTQLRAIYRASAHGNLAVMFPMIASVQEVKRIKEILREVKAELRAESLPFDEKMEVGVMLETPASIMISRDLAKEVDFFSVGTNDLTQYTLAMDRQTPCMDECYDAHHPAILAMIRMAVKNVHAEGKRIGICGELGADTELTKEFIKMGIDELSVVPSAILPIRKRIMEIE